MRSVRPQRNRAWKSEAARHRVRFTDVNHSRMEFTRATAGHQHLSGTQLLDQVWRHIKQYVAKSLRSRDSDTRRFNQRLSVYLFSYAHRYNTGKDLWGELGRLCRTHLAALI